MISGWILLDTAWGIDFGSVELSWGASGSILVKMGISDNEEPMESEQLWETIENVELNLVINKPLVLSVF